MLIYHTCFCAYQPFGVDWGESPYVATLHPDNWRGAHVCDARNPPSQNHAYSHASRSDRCNTEGWTVSARKARPRPNDGDYAHRAWPEPSHLEYGRIHHYSWPTQSWCARTGRAHPRRCSVAVRCTWWLLRYWLQARRVCCGVYLSGRRCQA